MPGEGVPPPKAAAPPENPIEIPTGDPTVPMVSLPVREMAVIQPAGLMPVKGADRSFGMFQLLEGDKKIGEGQLPQGRYVRRPGVFPQFQCFFIRTPNHPARAF